MQLLQYKPNKFPKNQHPYIQKLSSMSAQTISYSDIANRQIGLGIAVVITGLIAGIVLQLTKRVRQMPAYFRYNFSFFKDKSSKVLKVATILYYILLATPVILLIVWVILLGVNVGVNPALPVLFIGIFIILIFIPTYSKLFYLKILLMFFSYITAEMLALGLVFDSGNQTSFWALTALSLTLNAIFVIMVMWFIDDQVWSIPQNTQQSLLNKIIKETKIWKQKQNPPEVIDGGLYGKISNLSTVIRVIIIIAVYLLSLCVLMAYSLIGKFSTTYNFQALVNSVAIVTTDIITCMLLVISKKIGFEPNFNALIVVAVRICIIAFSGNFWFIGYCLLYLILMLYISLLIINKYYPTFEKTPVAEFSKINYLKMPEIPALFLILMFSGLVYFMGRDQGQNLPVVQAKLGEGTYPFWAIGVSSILLSFAIFFYLISARIVQRSILKIRATTIYYFGCESCGEYYFFLFTSYAFLIVLGFHLYGAVGRNIIWASCIFLPLFYESFIIFYSNWKQNDYLLLGDIEAFNKKIKKRQERQQKIRQQKNSVISKLKEQNKDAEQMIMVQNANMVALENAQIQDNWIQDSYNVNKTYLQWREQVSLFEALKTGKLLPTDKRIIISIPIMILTLLAYSLTFFFTQNRDMTAFTVSVQIIVLFLIFIPTKRYFSTFQKPNVSQIVLFILGIVLNYAFGIVSYAVQWNRSPAYTVLWSVINLLLVTTYAGLSLLRDKGISIPTIIANIVSMVLSFGPGIILLVWFKSIALGIALIGVGFYYTYFVSIYLVYIKMNNSVPFIVYIITIILIILTCCAVMIYSFLVDDFDDFYGFSITYLVVNLLALIYSTYRVGYDILSRADKPNFYSPYGLPIFKYDFNIKSVVDNAFPVQIWLTTWFMFYAYTILMHIFIYDTNYGISASMIPLIVFALSFFYIVTYNLNRAGKIKDDITPQLLESSWQDVLKAQQKNLCNFLNLDELEKQLADAKSKLDNGQQRMKTKTKVNPAQAEGKLKQKQKQDPDQTMTNIKSKQQKQQKQGKQIQIQVQTTDIIYDLEIKIDKAIENDKILLVNFWTNIVFKTQSKRKRKMLEFINFIKDSSDILAASGITLVLHDSLYDLELIYNQAFQELSSLSPLQRVIFNKQFKLYLERKQSQQKQKDEVNKKQEQDTIKRQKQLQKKIMQDDKKKVIEDPNMPIQQMKDGPAKLKRLKQTLKTPYTDNQFRTTPDIVPPQYRAIVRGWKRPNPKSYVIKNQVGVQMSIRQGSIGDCYLISAIGVLGKERIKTMISDSAESPPGAYMVKFKKFNRDLYYIIDDVFPVIDPGSDNQWVFGRCEDKFQIFCNIIEKAYAKMYGGYHNIQGGKVSLALSELIGGFPEEIQLKQYQQTNTSQIFQKMIEFKKSGYLLGAGSPPNPRGDAALIDGIYQGHAYLILDVRNLDGNKLIKLRNPHGNDSKQSTLDWSDDSPKWTARLKGLLGETMGKDGAFWMGLQDFVYCFRAIYVCRIFDSTWKRVGPYAGQWKGTSAAGLRSANGNEVLLKNNPHYGIRVTKACTLFIQLAQNQTVKGQGKNQIFFMIQRNSGKRIDAPATNKMVGMSGPAINSKTITKQMNLTAPAFPYTFSLMAATYTAGSEGSFNLSFYCNDSSIQIIEDATFDR